MDKQLNIGDVDIESGIKSTVSNINPETGQITWDIEYVPDFDSAYELFYKLRDNLNSLHKASEKDPDLYRIIKNTIKSFNDFRTYLRNNYPSQYKKFKNINEGNIKNIIYKKVNEISATGVGASYNSGTGEQYTTKYAFNPNKKAKGAEHIYYYKMGFTPVDMNKMIKQQKGMDYKQLWKEYVLNENFNLEDYIQNLNVDDSKKKDFIIKRLVDFDEIEKKLNELIPLLQQAKQKTADKYKQNPNYAILYPTDLAQEYLDDLITLFKQ